MFATGPPTRAAGGGLSRPGPPYVPERRFVEVPPEFNARQAQWRRGN